MKNQRKFRRNEDDEYIVDRRSASRGHRRARSTEEAALPIEDDETEEVIRQYGIDPRRLNRSN